MDGTQAQRTRHLLVEIEALRRRREELSADDYLGKLDLKEQERELITELAELRASVEPTTDQMRAELAAGERKLKELDGQRIDVVRQSGGGGQGADFGLAMDALKPHWQIDQGSGRAGLEARAAELRRRLTEHESE